MDREDKEQIIWRSSTGTGLARKGVDYQDGQPEEEGENSLKVPFDLYYMKETVQPGLELLSVCLQPYY